MFDLDVITGGTIENNNFAGALGIAKPQLYDQYLTDMTECGNTYGLNGGQLDGSCPIDASQPEGRCPRGSECTATPTAIGGR